jgi:hypothetical protein
MFYTEEISKTTGVFLASDLQKLCYVPCHYKLKSFYLTYNIAYITCILHVCLISYALNA